MSSLAVPGLLSQHLGCLIRCCLALYYDASSLVLARGLSPVCSKSALGATNGFLDRPWISDKSAITDRTSQGVESPVPRNHAPQYTTTHDNSWLATRVAESK